MFSRWGIAFIAVAAIVQGAWAMDLTLKADSGFVKLRQSRTGSWAQVKDSAAIGINDSIAMDDNAIAALKIGAGTVILLKGETRLCLQGSDTNVTIPLDNGQIMLVRDEWPEARSIKIVAVGCSFTPLGTAAAVKLTKAHEPSVAVIRGKMRMDAPSGETMTVEPGNFGTFSPTSGKFKQGKIPPDAAAALEKWSNAAPSQASPVSNATSPRPDSTKRTNAQISENNNAGTPAATSSPAPAAAQAPSAGQQSSSPAPGQPTTQQEPSPPAKKESEGQPASSALGVSWEFSASSITVDGRQWTRFSLSPDIPLGKFGVGLDLECFFNDSGNISDKEWNFDKSHWKKSLSSKLKYLRFGHENDPFFAKIGGLSSVTLGYGFIVDRFTNMLHYPDQKLLGVQLYLNNIGPMGLTLQTMTPDILEFNDKGGIFAGRVAVCPLKTTGLPFLGALSVGATVAMDVNEFAPARSWNFLGNLSDKNGNGLTDWDWAYQHAKTHTDSDNVQWDVRNHIVDTTTVVYSGIDTVFRDSTRRYALLGGDIGMPVIKNGLLQVDVYGQAGVVADSNMLNGKRTGWGVGVPGVRLTTGLLTAQVEYRHVHGKFTPNYFSAYYMDERLLRYPSPIAKSDAIPSVDLDGVFGSVGANIMNLVLVSGAYQYMAGANDCLDQRFEATGSLGNAILKRIPKINKAEMYFYKTNINRTPVVYKMYKTRTGTVIRPALQNGTPVYDEFFEQTPTLFWGYRLGFEIAKGATLIWDTRYGYQWTSTFPYRLVPYNNISIGTAITF